MKAKINKRGVLELHPETKEESEQLFKWYQKEGAKVIIPDERVELAVCRFNSLDIAIFAEPYKKENLSNRFYEIERQFKPNSSGV